MSSVQSPESIVDESALLMQGCERNVPLELHRVDTIVTHPVARGRMLEMTDDRIFIENPQTIGRSVTIGVGNSYVAYFELGETILSFKTYVLESGCAVRLNDHKLSVGLAISRPQSVQPGQRRQAFRTSLATYDPIVASIHDAPIGMYEQAPTNARRFRARVIDGSAGGLCVLAEQLCARLNLYDEYFISFNLPAGGPLFCARTELRHVRPVRDGEAQRLGLMFLPWPDQARFNRSLEPFTRYLNSIQRNLRRTG